MLCIKINKWGKYLANFIVTLIVKINIEKGKILYKFSIAQSKFFLKWKMFNFMHPNNEYQSCFNNQRKLVSDYQRRKMLFRQIKPFSFFRENKRFLGIS